MIFLKNEILIAC